MVYLNPSGQLGGAEMSLLAFMTTLRSTEPRWSLRLISGEDGPLVAKATALGVSACVVPFPPALAQLGDAGAGQSGDPISWVVLTCKLFLAGTTVPVYVKRLRRAIRELAPDVLHSNGFKMHILGAWCRPQCIPLIWHVHDYVSVRPIMSRLLCRCAARCAAVVANSRSVADDVQAICGKRLKVHPIYNGIDINLFSPTGPVLDLDVLAGLPRADAGTLKIGLVGTLGRWKGHEVFLRALSLLPRDLAVRGYIVGDALYQTDGSQHSLPALRALAARLGLERKVGFTGFVEEPAAAMRALDIVVHASTEPEPFGLVIAEAMACGRAVIVSQAGGAAELIDAGENALGHVPGDAAALAKCIERLARDPSLRERLGAAGRRTAMQRFDRARLAKELIPVYRDAAAH